MLLAYLKKPLCWGSFFGFDLMKRFFVLAAALIPCVAFVVLAEEVPTSEPAYGGDATPAPMVSPVPPQPIWPIVRVPKSPKGEIISSFGHRSVTVKGVVVRESHEGIDFSAPVGTSVRAVLPGKVIFTGLSKDYPTRENKKEWARLVIILHEDGSSARYVHLAGVKVSPRQMIAQGDVIASVSASDELPQPVLHLEWRDVSGKAVDPKLFLATAQ